MSSRSLLSLVIALLLSACASMRDAPEPDQYVDEDPMLSEYPVAHAVVPEAFVSASTPHAASVATANATTTCQR